MTRSTFLWLCVAMLTALWPARVGANAAQTQADSELTAELEVPAPDVRIDHEALVIDLRGRLGRRAAPHIEATYALVNDGARVVVPVRFVSAGSAGAKVEFDGKAVRTTTSEDPIPEAWVRAYAKAGSLNPSEDALSFALEIPPGAHTLSVAYATRGGWVDEIGERSATVDYLLAPAKHWGGFGVLEVTVLPPDGAEVIANVELERVDGELRGRFDGLPADVLHIVAREIDVTPAILRVVLALVGLLGLFVIIRYLPRAARKRHREPGLAAVGFGVAAAGLFVVWIYGYTFVVEGAIYAVIFLGLPASVVLGLVVAGAVLYYARAAAREHDDADS
ncbi:MAG: hypothetical protein AAF721_27230 [Myxococcota bacterium]